MPRSVRTAVGVTLVLLGAAGCGSGAQSKPSLRGAGSTLVAPLVSAWAAAYHDAQVGYNASGSGVGIQAITQGEVDFGGSEAPLSPAQEQSANGVLQIPWGLSATVLAYQLNGVHERLRLTGPAIAEIYLGKITNWDDPVIAKLNPGVPLPSRPITPAFRLDASGDTYALTDYLSKVSPAWKAQVGRSTVVDFPQGVGGRGNSGIASIVRRIDGTIGYVALPYAVESNLSYAAVQNAAARFRAADIQSISAAAETVKELPSDNAVSITDPPLSAPDAYPISTFTYALVPERSSKASALKQFLDYAVGEGQRLGTQFQFAPLPQIVQSADHATIARIHS